MIERWTSIPGYEEFYEISNKGQIRSLDPRDPGKIMKLELDRDEKYYVVRLTRFGIRKKLAVHRLVYTSFEEDLLPGEIVHHIDENKLNNWLNNLLKVNSVEHRRMHNKNLKPIFISIIN